MVKRRTVMWGLLGLGTAVASCRPSASTALKVKTLTRSVPSQVLKAFGKEIPAEFEAEANLVDIYQQLQRWQTQSPLTLSLWERLQRFTGFLGDKNSDEAAPPTIATQLVTLSDPWLEHAIDQELIQPLPKFALVDKRQEFSKPWPLVEKLENLPKPWPQLLLRRYNQGQPELTEKLWAVPYRTQGLMIAYQKHIFQSNTNTKPITKWADLWRPELAGRIAMPNQPRLAAAIVLKALEYSVNDEAALAQDNVKEQLVALYRQVKVFDSQDYLKALVNEDVWLAVGWSGDILATLVRYRRLDAVHPQEGTILTSDLWVAPAGAELTEAAQAWIDFCWQPPMATQISVSSYGVSPLFFLPDVEIPRQLEQQTLLMPENGEVLLPLSPRGQTNLATLLSVDVPRE